MTAIDYYNRGNAEPDENLEFSLYKDALSQNEVKILSENYINYPNNPQLEQWSIMVMNDPKLSGMLGLTNAPAAPAPVGDWASTSAISRLYPALAGAAYWLATTPFTGTTAATGNPATTFLLKDKKQ